MKTTDKSADALTDHLYILSANEEAMEEAIERFVGSSTGEALKCVLHAQKQIRTLLVTPVEQHETAPCDALEGTGNGADEWTAFDWLRTEISAVDCWYRGDPSYEHDAYWMKERALKLVADAEEIFRAPRTEVAAFEDVNESEGAGQKRLISETVLEMHSQIKRTNEWVHKGAIGYVELDELEKLGAPEFADVAESHVRLWHPANPPSRALIPVYIAPQPPSADAAAAPADEPSELEQVVACLGDDAATLRHSDEYVEMADNMEAAARLLESLAEDRAADEMCNRWPWQRGTSQPAAEPTIPAELHHDTAKLVRRFAHALGNKLLSAQRKYGYSDNWMRDDWADECRAELMRHIQKGDPRDVAAYCAFLWHHNESTAATAGQEAAVYQILTEEGAWLDVPHKIYERKKSDPALTRVVYTAPPAQVATRQGLTNVLRQAREELAQVEWENDPPARITDLFSKIDALLEGANHA